MRTAKSVKLSLYGGGLYNVRIVPLNREKVYGERVIVPLDRNNQECKSALVSEDGKGLFPNGSISICKMNEDGTASYQPKVKGETVINDDNDEQSFYTKGQLNLLHEFIPAAGVDFLNSVDSLYTLEGSDKFELMRDLGGKIFTMFFRLTKRGAVKKAFVFENHGTIFMELCKPVDFVTEYAGKGQSYQIDDEPLVQELDDIDFNLF